jgi:hypothetical protein
MPGLLQIDGLVSGPSDVAETCGGMRTPSSTHFLGQPRADSIVARSASFTNRPDTFAQTVFFQS